MELVFLDYRLKGENINLVIHHNTITGLINDSENTFFDLKSLKKMGRGQIIIDNEKTTKDDIIINQKRISQIKDNIKFPSYLNTIEELMNNKNERFFKNSRNR